MTPRNAPTHSLALVKAAVQDGRWLASGKVLRTASAVYCDRRDIEECIASLTEEDFRKSMPSEAREGRWQDVYKVHYYSMPIYLKFDYSSRTDRVILLSFKLDEDP